MPVVNERTHEENAKLTVDIACYVRCLKYTPYCELGLLPKAQSLVYAAVWSNASSDKG